MKWLKDLLGIGQNGMPRFHNPPSPPKPILELELVSLLQETDWKILVLWWHELNTWGWPTELLPEEKPDLRDGGKRTAIMNFIDRKVSHETILRHLNVNVEKRMTHDEFDDFWQYTRGKDKHAERRYHAATKSRIEKQAGRIS